MLFPLLSKKWPIFAKSYYYRSMHYPIYAGKFKFDPLCEREGETRREVMLRVHFDKKISQAAALKNEIKTYEIQILSRSDLILNKWGGG